LIFHGENEFDILIVTPERPRCINLHFPALPTSISILASWYCFARIRQTNRLPLKAILLLEHRATTIIGIVLGFPVCITGESVYLAGMGISTDCQAEDWYRYIPIACSHPEERFFLGPGPNQYTCPINFLRWFIHLFGADL
jgi:hypothetical protein